MIWPIIPRAHWKHCAVFALLFGTGLHLAERCIAGAAMVGAL